MTQPQNLPAFDVKFGDVNRFIHSLVDRFNKGELRTWDDLDDKVGSFFTEAQINNIENLIPGWRKIASDENGITQAHTMCAMLGLFMMPEFQALTTTQQKIAQWIVFLHDIGKTNINGRGDAFHAFRSAIISARALPGLGFSTTNLFSTRINEWSEFVNSSKYEIENGHGGYMPDNTRIGDIFTGIYILFGKDSPAALILRGITLHQSISGVKAWPQTAPLNEEQVQSLIDKELLPLLKVMHLADCEGWTLFKPEIRALQRKEMLEAFEELEHSIHQPN